MSATYAVVDTDGDLTTHTDTDYRRRVGPEGPARVELHPAFRATGFVNDCGLALPDKYTRNVVGSLLLITLGASMQPYAGQVVITGWDPLPGIEVCSLTNLDYVQRMHGEVRLALGLDQGRSTLPSNWAVLARQLAEDIKTSPKPTITMTPLGGRHV